ncbi:hypothetical protein HYH03_008820 [Edaphochlamys debaryana]|uniref:Uncharacterized protein n=1 Tax=Edaphochlamys debaryana TaxID=47281 RepID=A0A835Y2I4_9CHLO|nr:hypothetical protein HYH03_008820 [Edaphochlamys debaryana]|eukprot:KAG2492906.1 hypothetical protein HYH03_008820 [Edaphochlamys debaryana]
MEKQSDLPGGRRTLFLDLEVLCGVAVGAQRWSGPPLELPCPVAVSAVCSKPGTATTTPAALDDLLIDSADVGVGPSRDFGEGAIAFGPAEPEEAPDLGPFAPRSPEHVVSAGAVSFSQLLLQTALAESEEITMPRAPEADWGEEPSDEQPPMDGGMSCSFVRELAASAGASELNIRSASAPCAFYSPAPTSLSNASNVRSGSHPPSSSALPLSLMAPPPGPIPASSLRPGARRFLLAVQPFFTIVAFSHRGEAWERAMLQLVDPHRQCLALRATYTGCGAWPFGTIAPVPRLLSGGGGGGGRATSPAAARRSLSADPFAAADAAADAETNYPVLVSPARRSIFGLLGDSVVQVEPYDPSHGPYDDVLHQLAAVLVRNLAFSLASPAVPERTPLPVSTALQRLGLWPGPLRGSVAMEILRARHMPQSPIPDGGAIGGAASAAGGGGGSTGGGGGATGAMQGRTPRRSLPQRGSVSRNLAPILEDGEPEVGQAGGRSFDCGVRRGETLGAVVSRMRSNTAPGNDSPLRGGGRSPPTPSPDSRFSTPSDPSSAGSGSGPESDRLRYMRSSSATGSTGSASACGGTGTGSVHRLGSLLSSAASWDATWGAAPDATVDSPRLSSVGRGSRTSPPKTPPKSPLAPVEEAPPANPARKLASAAAQLWLSSRFFKRHSGAGSAGADRGSRRGSGAGSGSKSEGEGRGSDPGMEPFGPVRTQSFGAATLEQQHSGSIAAKSRLRSKAGVGRASGHASPATSGAESGPESQQQARGSKRSASKSLVGLWVSSLLNKGLSLQSRMDSRRGPKSRSRAGESGDESEACLSDLGSGGGTGPATPLPVSADL